MSISFVEASEISSSFSASKTSPVDFTLCRLPMEKLSFDFTRLDDAADDFDEFSERTDEKDAALNIEEPR